MKKSVPILLMMCMPFIAVAKSLRMEMNDGTFQTYNLTDRPVVRFQNDNVLITSGNLSSEYPRAQVKNFTFTDASTALDGLVRDEVSYSYDGKSFRCEDRNICIFDIRGINVAGGYGEVSVAGLPSGLYIVKTNSQTIKIIKK